MVWCGVSTGHARPYVTAKFQRKVFTSLHGLEHPSHRVTKPLINTRFVWHGMYIEVANWCRSCKGGQTTKISGHNKPVFGTFTEPTERFYHVHIDIVGPLPYSDGFKYLLTFVDRFTPWPEAIPLVYIKAETVADAFFCGWIARFGTPATTWIEALSWNQDCGIICVTSSALSEAVQRATTSRRTAWSNVFNVSSRPPLWHTNHRIHGLSRCKQCNSAFDPP